MQIVGVAFSSNFALQRQSSGFGQKLEIQELGLDIKTGIETFRIGVLLLRLVSRLSGLQSCK